MLSNFLNIDPSSQSIKEVDHNSMRNDVPFQLLHYLLFLFALFLAVFLNLLFNLLFLILRNAEINSNGLRLPSDHIFLIVSLSNIFIQLINPYMDLLEHLLILDVLVDSIEVNTSALSLSDHLQHEIEEMLELN